MTQSMHTSFAPIWPTTCISLHMARDIHVPHVTRDFQVPTAPPVPPPLLKDKELAVLKRRLCQAVSGFQSARAIYSTESSSLAQVVIPRRAFTLIACAATSETNCADRVCVDGPPS